MPLSRIQTTILSGDTSDSVVRSLLIPAAPTNLSVTGGNAQATLSWTEPTGVISQAPITDYREQYSTDDGTTWTNFTAAASTATSATVTGLTNGTAVRFRVAAVNGVGVGAYTAASSAIRPGVASAPTGLNALAGNTQIALSWTAPANTGASSITGYTVEYTPSGGSAQTVSTGSTATSYTLTGLTNGTAYTVRVRAVSAAGNGDYSTAATGTPTGVPGVPTSASIRNGGYCNEVYVEWQPPASDGGSPITGYRVIGATAYWGNCKPFGSAPSNSTNCGHDITYSAATRSVMIEPPGNSLIRFAIFAINSAGSSAELVISNSHRNGYCD